MKRLFTFLSERPSWTFFLAITWTIVIFIGCSLPGKEIPKLGLFAHVDKVIHFSFFIVFFLLWSIRVKGNFRTNLCIFLIAIAYGFGLEFYQLHFVAGRSFDVWDGIADTAGALVGWGLTSQIIRLTK